MCGIAGFLKLASATGARAHQLGARMCQQIQHRGPDGGGVTESADVVLGMVRLAIVDVEHGAQPMFNDDESVAIVFNGEIYNAPELRRALENDGVRFRTRSDTEVILRLYEQAPDSVEQNLRGMWAFAVHDRRRRVVVLSRDRFGIKPLFVADAGKALAFGSELRAFSPLRDDPTFERLFTVDRGAAHAMLAWSYVPNDDTIYAGVKRLSPATRLEIDLTTGKRTATRHYELRASTDAGRVRTLDEACELVDPLLRRAVKEHLESDVPVAAFLSGGIDSSLILAYACEESAKPVQAFTIGFRDPRFDESKYAREIAKRLSVSLHVEMFDEAAARASLSDALAAYDEPFGDSSSLANFLLSRVVSHSHKVALGGDGGDEVFAGYKKHQIVRMRRFASHLPRGGRESIAWVLRHLPGRSSRGGRYADLVRIGRRVGRAMGGTDDVAYLRLTQVAGLDATAHLVRTPADSERFVGPILRAFDAASGTPLRRTLMSDIANVLPNAMLTKVDRASMACRLEARVPMLDHRVVEAGLGLPEAFTLHRNGKRVLRELYARRFGRVLAERRKTGFDVPVDAWLEGPLLPRCASLFGANKPISDILSSAFERDWRGVLAREPQVFWHAFTLATWMEHAAE